MKIIIFKQKNNDGSWVTQYVDKEGHLTEKKEEAHSLPENMAITVCEGWNESQNVFEAMYDIEDK